jgi:hypothetical protein
MKVQTMSRHFKLWTLCLATLCVAFLSGCSTVRVIESQVQTNAQWLPQNPAPAKAQFRLERLPADVNNMQAGWAEVELVSALAPLGWTRNDVDAQYSVWIGVRTAEYITDTWGRPVRGPWINHVYIRGGTGYRPRGVSTGVSTGVGWSLMTPVYPGMRHGFPPTVSYAQEVSIIIRDLSTSQVVYQTKATHDGPWSDHANILRTMISAALQGFPSPSTVKRRVDIPISR